MEMVIQRCLLLMTLVHQSTRSQRLVVNTTCVELTKSSNKPLRLPCDNPDHYHCLLDETYTREYEVCRVWKWISKGDCAYFNLFGEGNIDRKDCKPLENMICSPKDYPSYENTKYTACYVKRNSNTDGHMETTSSSGVSSSVSSVASDGMNKTLPPNSTNMDKTTQKQMQALYSVLGVLVPILSLCGIYVVFKHSKCLNHGKAHRFGDPESNNRNTCGLENALSPTENVNSAEQEPLISAVKTDDIPLMSGSARETNPVIQVQNGEETVEILVENTSGHSEHSGNVQMNKNSPEEPEEREENKTTTDSENETNPVIQAQNCEKRSQVEVSESVENTSGHSEQSGNAQTSDESGEEPEEREEIKTAADINDANHGKEEEIFEMAPSSPLITPPGSRNDPDNDHASDYESTEVFDDTIESLQREVTTEIDEQEGKQCRQLYDLLLDEGLDLIQEVLRLVTIRTVGRTPEESLADETVKHYLKTILPEESHRIITNPKDGGTSIGVLYGLIQLYSGEKPKSGWGNPVKGSDTGIDDVEILHRIFTICKEISSPEAISVDNYVRLFDLLIPALTRLDSDGELKDSDGECKDSGGALKDKYKVLADKLKAILNPTWSQSVHKAINSFVKLWSPWQQ